MIEIDHSNIDNKFKVFANNTEIEGTVVEKPFYDPKKKLLLLKI